jgi:nucleoside-diphosphate-sugar epimerase
MQKSSYFWVSGSRGFVGSAFAAELVRRKIPCAFITNSNSSSGLVQIDFGSRPSIEKALRLYGVPKAYFHIGWGSVYKPDAESHLGDNLEQSTLLFETLFQNGVKKIISIGSGSEYGDLEGELHESQLPYGRLTKYAQAKIESCYRGLSLAQSFNASFIHTRLFHAMGVSRRSGALINQVFRAYKESKVLQLTSCDNYRDYIWIGDVVEALLRLVSVEESGIVNLGGGRSSKLRDVIELFWKKLSAPENLLQFGILQRPNDEPTQPKCYASLARLRSWTNWTPPTSLDDALSRTIADFRKRGYGE